MAFNFGAFLSGMGKQIVRDIDEAEERQFKFDMLAEEEATRMRLADADERRKTRKEDKENAAFLKTLGYNDAQAQWIMKGGSAAVTQYANFANAANQNGFSASSILDSNLINDDHNDPRNESNINGIVSETFQSRTEIDPTDPFRLNLSVFAKKKEEEDDFEIGSIKVGYATSLNERLSAKRNFGEDSEEYKIADENVAYWKTQMENDPSKEADRLFSPDSRETVIKNARANAAMDAGFKFDIETGIVQAIKGKAGPQAIASLEAAGEIAIAARPTDNFYDDVLMARAIGIQKKAERTLESHAKAVANKRADQETTNFGYNKTEVNNAGDYVINSFSAALKSQDRGDFKEGDVIIVKQKNQQTGQVEFRIKVYTGIPRAETPLGIFDTFFDAGVYTP